MKHPVELMNLFWTTAGIFPVPRIIEAFAALCTKAEAYGATIGFEFMASAMIDNLADARTLVETVGAKNGGLIPILFK